VKLNELYTRYESIIPDFDVFMDYISRPIVQSLRVNTLKAEREKIIRLLSDIKLEKLPFYQDGFRARGKYALGNHVTHGLGLIYVQEVASMIPVIVLDPKPHEVVMDLCAAPGSKTTQIAQLMANSGLLVANEISRKRIRGLTHNIKRCGLLNEVVISVNGQKIHRVFTDYFDRILIDAPCSAEGTIRKSKAVLFHWGIKNIQRMSRLQIGLLVAAFRALRPGGSLVYSTCTIAPEENEMVVSYLLEKYPEAELLPVEVAGFKLRPGIKDWQGVRFDPRVEHCARVLPQDNDTAPFFIARFTKRGIQKPRMDYLGKIEQDNSLLGLLARKFGVAQERFKSHAVFRGRDESYVSTREAFSFREVKVLRKGLEFAKVYDQEIKPDNDLIQLIGRHATRNRVEMKEYQVKKFMRGEILKVGSLPDIEKGFVIVCLGKLPVGMGKYNGIEIRSAVKRERRIP
jgi:NOL1/NOP2/sun family putative RNA methylase